MPEELELLAFIDRFGALAVMGRTLSAGEMRRMMTAENVVKWAAERAKAENWAAWAKEHPHKAALLAEAMREGKDYGE